MLLCRDGVSEGQFYQVLLYELDAIRKVWFHSTVFSKQFLLLPSIFCVYLRPVRLSNQIINHQWLLWLSRNATILGYLQTIIKISIQLIGVETFCLVCLSDQMVSPIVYFFQLHIHYFLKFFIRSLDFFDQILEANIVSYFVFETLRYCCWL